LHFTFLIFYIILCFSPENCGLTACWDNAQIQVRKRLEWDVSKDDEAMKLWGLSYVAVDRVPQPFGPNLQPIAPRDVDWEFVFPDTGCFQLLKDIMVVCVKKILVTCLPFSASLPLPEQPPHKFSQELSAKSKVVKIWHETLCKHLIS
jgi:hypothetical protein